MKTTVHFFCGKMAAGKSTLARDLAETTGSVLLCEDLWLSKLVGDQITTFDDYLKFAARLKDVLFPHAVSLLKNGNSIVFDYPGNTAGQRAWFRGVFEAAHVDHCLHHIVASDDLCLRQLAKRNQDLPEGSRVSSEAEFASVTAYFQPPTQEEGFNTKVYDRDQGC